MRHNAIAGDSSGIRGRTWLRAGFLLTMVCSVAVAGDRGKRSRNDDARESSTRAGSCS